MDSSSKQQQGAEKGNANICGVSNTDLDYRLLSIRDCVPSTSYNSFPSEARLKVLTSLPSAIYCPTCRLPI